MPDSPSYVATLRQDTTKERGVRGKQKNPAWVRRYLLKRLAI